MNAPINISRQAQNNFTKTAPSRGLSPSRSTSPLRNSAQMPPPRSTPIIRPNSPLSPRYEMPQSRFDGLQSTSPRSIHSRNAPGQRRPNPKHLNLPPLPKFHPANFPSGQSSQQTTPGSGGTSPQPPMSPRSHQRMYSDAQRQLYFYQRESMAAVARATSPSDLGKPRLVPLSSPGPVTPLELEGSEGYVVAGARSTGRGVAPPEELVDRLIKEEARRRTIGSTESRPSGR